MTERVRIGQPDLSTMLLDAGVASGDDWVADVRCEGRWGTPGFALTVDVARGTGGLTPTVLEPLRVHGADVVKLSAGGG